MMLFSQLIEDLMALVRIPSVTFSNYIPAAGFEQHQAERTLFPYCTLTNCPKR